MIKLSNHFGRAAAYSDEEAEREFEAFCRYLGRRVSEERVKRGLKASDLAQSLGLSPSYIKLIEQGERMPSIRALLRICSLFGIPPGELIETREGGDVPDTDKNHDEIYAEVCAELNALTEEELSVAAELLRAFRKLCAKA